MIEAGFVGLLILVLLAILWIVLLKKQIGEKTSFLQQKIAEHKQAESALQKAKEELEIRVEERTAKLKTVNDQLQQKNSEIEEDLSLSAITQQVSYTKTVKKPYIDASVRYLPYNQVSGDFYDISVSATNDYNFFIGDVTGHGVSAALITMIMKTALTHINPFSECYEILAHLNQELEGNIPMDKFSTGIYARITPTGILTVSNAGHPPVIILSHDGTNTLLESSGAPLGVFSDVDYRQKSIYLDHGDRILFYTDGVIEATNLEEEQFGTENLIQFFDKRKECTLENIVEGLMIHLKKFTNNHFGDDITIIALEFLDPEGKIKQFRDKSLIQETQLLDYVHQLKNSRLFKNLSDELFSQLIPVSQLIDYPVGAEILEDGQENENLHVLLEGSVSISKDNHKILSLHRLGDFFGEMSIISNKPCSATVTAITPVKLLLISGQTITDRHSAGDHDLIKVFYQISSLILVDKLHLTTEKANALAKENVAI